MARIPDAVQTLLASFSEDFAPSVWQQFLSLLTVVVIVRGRRTVWRLIWWSPDRSNAANHPVVQVIYNDMEAFCQWLSTMLPSI